MSQFPFFSSWKGACIFGTVMFLLGAVLGPIGDYCHVISETTSYPSEVYQVYLFKIIPFWVPILFGSAGKWISFSQLFVRPRALVPDIPAAVLGGLGFVGLYCLSGFLPGEAGSVNDLVLAAGALGMWAVLDRTLLGLVIAGVTAALGTAVEVTLVSHGIFAYLPRAANFFGVASWLPWLYIAAAVGVGSIARPIAAALEYVGHDKDHWKGELR